MRIAIYGKSLQPSFTQDVQNLFARLNQLELEACVYEPFYAFLKPKLELEQEPKTFSSHEDLKSSADCLISIGGDGTLLETVRLVRDSGIPVLGINTGRLGFLSSVSAHEIDQALESISKKDYLVDARSLIELETDEGLFGEVNYAINEVSIYKRDTSSMITVHTSIDEEYLNSYWADGLIIATPTGSTAYSLSCGGPIVVPGTENFILTPISPHNLNVRPIVISNDKTISLKIEGRSDQFLVTLDSRSELLSADTELRVKKAPFNFNLIILKNQSFYETIRGKLNWGLDKRN